LTLVVTAGMCVSETLADEVVVMMIMVEGKRLKVEGAENSATVSVTYQLQCL